MSPGVPFHNLKTEGLWHFPFKIYSKNTHWHRNLKSTVVYCTILMALVQRFTSTVSAQHTAGGTYDLISGDGTANVLKDIATVQNRDLMEKQQLNSLNDRLEDLIGYLDGLEAANKQLSDDIHSLIDSWGITGENRFRLLQDLDQVLSRLKDTNRNKIILNVESKIFDEQAEILNRISAMYMDVLNLYQEKYSIIKDLQGELEDEFRKIQHRLQLSDEQVKKLDQDYRAELEKFRQYMIEWSKIALEKQQIVNEIQSLKEQYNLKMALNHEEILEWQRLLQRFSHDSTNYYKDSLETIKQQIYNDYEQMAKEQHLEIEQTLKTRLSEIQEKVSRGLPMSDQGEQKRLEQSNRFESKLEESQHEHDHWNNEYRRLLEDTQRKRRQLQDLESEQNSQQQKDHNQHERLKQTTNTLKEEYYQMKDELDRLAYSLRFSVEEELKIYEALLNSLHRKKDERINLNQRRIITSGSTTIEQQEHDRNIPTIRIEEPNGTNRWQFDTLSRHSSTQSGDKDRLASTSSNYAEQYKSKTDMEKYDFEQNITDKNKTTTTTVRQFIHVTPQPVSHTLSEIDEELLQKKVHITRKYKGTILIKFVDVSGRFVEIENMGDYPRDLTDWYIIRDVDGRRFEYNFPVYELEQHTSVRIYGNYHRPSNDITNEPQLITKFHDWGNGRSMETRLYSKDNKEKAFFEQTIRE
ncbi:unnamed protein product [Didymodactylos carnosus]|uniref:LTD domain-containing protein n=1 Tax=Didymodactylos carnosus TaxID=1234261 RepID=A0A813WYI0_9BILA|nr:unnamed protein product [Didymodactylos carnosus]CAF0861761.1 unnamed protein product [Didymodactylos carnosus]CAF3529653.1 unnamed protein product [Didymodactylos carnosus]CAF3649418.1 unnamed protein product [Didymodactylos carnosus]